jgi:hypothetical protein
MADSAAIKSRSANTLAAPAEQTCSLAQMVPLEGFEPPT